MQQWIFFNDLVRVLTYLVMICRDIVLTFRSQGGRPGRKHSFIKRGVRLGDNVRCWDIIPHLYRIQSHPKNPIHLVSAEQTCKQSHHSPTRYNADRLVSLSSELKKAHLGFAISTISCGVIPTTWTRQWYFLGIVVDCCTWYNELMGTCSVTRQGILVVMWSLSSRSHVAFCMASTRNWTSGSNSGTSKSDEASRKWSSKNGSPAFDAVIARFRKRHQYRQSSFVKPNRVNVSQRESIWSLIIIPFPGISILLAISCSIIASSVQALWPVPSCTSRTAQGWLSVGISTCKTRTTTSTKLWKHEIWSRGVGGDVQLGGRLVSSRNDDFAHSLDQTYFYVNERRHLPFPASLHQLSNANFIRQWICPMLRRRGLLDVSFAVYARNQKPRGMATWQHHVWWSVFGRFSWSY